MLEKIKKFGKEYVDNILGIIILVLIIHTLYLIFLGIIAINENEIDSFSFGFLQNLYPDLIVGFAIVYWIRKREQKAEKEKRKYDIYKMIKEELLKNKKHFDIFMENLSEYRIILPFIMTEYWESLKDGGQLYWIEEDLELFKMVVRIYTIVDTIKFMEKEYYCQILNNYPDNIEKAKQITYLNVGFKDGYLVFNEEIEKFLGHKEIIGLEVSKDLDNIDF